MSRNSDNDQYFRKGHLSYKLSHASLLMQLLLLISLFSTSSHHQATASQQQQQQQQQQQSIEEFLKQNFPQTSRALPLSQEGAQFDATSYKSVYEAIRAHPDLREFAALCEARGVKEIVSMDKTPLSVFAPIDRSLSDLMFKVRSSTTRINLLELAKHHIAQGLVMPNDEGAKYPWQFNSYAQLSPIYLNSIQTTTGGQHNREFYVNNARIVASYLISIDSEGNYQALHLIDMPLDYVYLNKSKQLRATTSANNKQVVSVKRPISLDELLMQAPSSRQQDELASAILEFSERFGDLRANLAQADVCHTRALRSSDPSQRIGNLITKESLQFEHLSRQLAQTGSAATKRLLNGSESATLNTYFLPINSEELEQLCNSSPQKLAEALEAHIIPDQVLFTRQMGLGRVYETITGSGRQITLSLAKTIDLQSSAADAADETRKLLSSALLLEAETSGNQESSASWLPAGLTTSEIVLGNIPLSNGVLHLLRKPVVGSGSNLLDYINDSDKQLSNVVRALGSRSLSLNHFESVLHKPEVAPQLNRFRELLARDRQLLATFSLDQHHQASNRTILAPSDEAFSRLRYDLRALISGDERLVPSHWDPNYKQELLDRLLKRHIITDQALTSGQLRTMATSSMSVLSARGQVIHFGLDQGLEPQLVAECDGGPRARLTHRNLAASNGILHVLDRVLGEDQETLSSLLESLSLKQAQDESLMLELNQLIGSPSTEDSVAPQPSGAQQKPEELGQIVKAVSRLLEEMSEQRRSQLSTSVNISQQLAQLASKAEGRQEEWLERFKSPQAKLTYFVPNDLAWLRLQQMRPELYRPLVYFLERNGLEPRASQEDAAAAAARRRPSESSHRFLQILERHLIGNRKLSANELNRLSQLESSGATLRLVDIQSQSGFSLASEPHHQPQQIATQQQQDSSSAFAALHSIIGGSTSVPGQQQIDQQQQRPIVSKALKLATSGSGQANIVAAHEASNGYVYLIDQVLLLPEDLDYLQQTSPVPVGSAMSSLLGAHQSALLEILHTFFGTQASESLLTTLIGTLSCAIFLLIVVIALVLVRRRRNQNKLNRHQQLESGLTSSSTASNSGSTSTTKSL